MKEYKVEIEIDEHGNIQAESKGMVGDVCVNELGIILNDLEGEVSRRKKPEFYQKTLSKQKTYCKS